MRRVVHPAGGSHDYHDQLVLPLISNALATAGIDAVVIPGDEATPGFATFQIHTADGHPLLLRINPSLIRGTEATPLLPLNEADGLTVRTVAGVDVMLLSSPGPTSVPVVYQALFQCGGLDWNLTPATRGPDVEQPSIELVEAMARELPC